MQTQRAESVRAQGPQCTGSVPLPGRGRCNDDARLGAPVSLADVPKPHDADVFAAVEGFDGKPDRAGILRYVFVNVPVVLFGRHRKRAVQSVHDGGIVDPFQPASAIRRLQRPKPQPFPRFEHAAAFRRPARALMPPICHADEL